MKPNLSHFLDSFGDHMQIKHVRVHWVITVAAFISLTQNRVDHRVGGIHN